MAPMANVTDAAFRRMFAECGKPDVFWTEFVSVEGLALAGHANGCCPICGSARPNIRSSPRSLAAKPEQFEAIAPLIKELGFDGIDINMGCPDRGVEKSGAGRSAY